MKAERPWLIFSDLDGTFLDHHSYSYEAALPTFQMTRKLGIPCIWNTSKTRDECLAFRRSLNPDCPFIVENGGAVFLPDPGIGNDALPFLDSFEDWTSEEDGRFRVYRFGPGRDRILEVLEPLRSEFSFTGFSRMSVQDVVNCTGLSAAEAKAARNRQFTEPLLWESSVDRLSDFRSLLEPQGLTAVRGGRFVHVSAPHDKGTALTWLRNLYVAVHHFDYHSIALGDGQNDLAMLKVADIAVAIKDSQGNRVTLRDHQRVLKPDSPGPAGWASAIQEALALNQQQQ